MTNNVFALSSAAMAATQAAAEQFQRAAVASTSSDYRLLYITQKGCGTFHDYANLSRAEAMGIKVEYVNITHPGQTFSDKNREGKLVTAPGNPVPFTDDRIDAYFKSKPDLERYLQNKAFNYLKSKQLEFYDATKAVLLDANGNLVHKFESTQGQNFIDELKSHLQPSLQQKRGVGRS